MSFEEIWKPIKEYENLYLVSNLGNVKSLHNNKEKLLKPIKQGEYIGVALNNSGKRKSFLIHRLVLQTFSGYKDGCIVNHKDGNKKNNHLDNLEWCSFSENVVHAIENNLLVPKKFRVSQFTLNGELLSVFNSIKEASEFTKINCSNISLICKNKKKPDKFIWKYTDFEYEELQEPDGKELEGYTNYIITKEGNVFSKSHKKYLSKRLNGGYEYVDLGNKKDKKTKKTFSIHFLVATLYIPNPFNFRVINHKNSIKTDNNVNNLEWTTHSLNTQQFVDEKLSIKVCKLDLNNNILETYKSIREASRKCNISFSSIVYVLKSKRNTAGGFKWKKASLI